MCLYKQESVLYEDSFGVYIRMLRSLRPYEKRIGERLRSLRCGVGEGTEDIMDKACNEWGGFE